MTSNQSARALTRALGIATVAAVAGALLPASTIAQPGQPIEKRKAVYEPWSPDQMKQRRKQLGLIGPGTDRPVTPPAFPSYLKKPDNVDALMPQARAAVRQTGGRTPFGLIEPGKTVLIVVGELRELASRHDGAGGDRTRAEGARRQCIIVKTWDLLGLSEAEYTELRSGVRTYRISDGQREIEYFFTVTGLMPAPQKGREWVRGRDPDLYTCDLAAREICQRAFRRNRAQSPRTRAEGVDRVARQESEGRLGRCGAAAAGQHSAGCSSIMPKNILGNYTYLGLYDLMSQVPAFPSDVWRLVETKTMEPLGSSIASRSPIRKAPPSATTSTRRWPRPGPRASISRGICYVPGAGDGAFPLFGR